MLCLHTCVAGEYGVNVYATKTNSKDRVHHVHSFLLRHQMEKTGTIQKTKCPQTPQYSFTTGDIASIKLPKPTNGSSVMVELKRKHHNVDDPNR